MQEFWKTGSQFKETAASTTEPLMPVILLVDGDIIAYRAAAAADGRFYEIDGQRFKYAADAKSYADKKSLPKGSIKSGYEPEPAENAINTVNLTIDAIKNYFIYSKKMLPKLSICLSCPRNFRYDIFPTYKESRKTERRPANLEACKEHLVKEHGAHRYDPFEADDLIAMMASQIPVEQETYIVSNDKDFTQLGRPGLKFYDFTVPNGKEWEVTELEALVYFYKQILTGDKSDDIPGIKGVGPETAIKLLDAASLNPHLMSKDVVDDLLSKRVISAYVSHGGYAHDEAMRRIQMTATLLYLVRDEDEVGLPWKFPDER